MEDDAPLRALADREAIRELAVRYAGCVWTKEVARLADLFASDGEMDTGGEILRGPQAILDAYARVFAADDFYPFIHNHVIDLDGDRATGRCSLDLRAVIAGQRMTGFGVYDDEYTRTHAGWKFRSRRLTMIELRDAHA